MNKIDEMKEMMLKHRGRRTSQLIRKLPQDGIYYHNDIIEGDLFNSLESLRPYVELGELVAYNTIWDIEYGLAKTHEVAFKIQQLMDKILGGESVERDPNDSRGANIRRNENKLSTYSTLQQIKEQENALML